MLHVEVTCESFDQPNTAQNKFLSTDKFRDMWLPVLQPLRNIIVLRRGVFKRKENRDGINVMSTCGLGIQDLDCLLTSGGSAASSAAV